MQTPTADTTQPLDGPNGNAVAEAPRGASKRRRRRRRARKPAELTNQPAQARVLEVEPIAKMRGRRTRRRQGLTARTDPRKVGSDIPDAYAALDLGTNNCRLLIAVPQQKGRFRVVDAFSRIVRLGEGLGSSGSLSEEAMDRAVEALKACSQKLVNRPVRAMKLIATEACRQADNGRAFLERVEREAGLKLELIDRQTEAHLAVAGCASLVDPETRGVVLFDIGGGSSELALLDLAKMRENGARPDYTRAIIDWTSLPIGVVTLSERHGGGRMVTPEVFRGMVREVEDMLVGFDDDDSLSEAVRLGDVHLLGTSGTVTTLAGIHLELPRYDRRRVDGTWMSGRQVTRIVDELVAMSYEQRIANPCIGQDRADLVLAGCAILVAIQNRWPCERLRVADRGLREGLLTRMMDEDDAWVKPPHRSATRQNA